ncbi:MAG: hypothetical protein COY82_01820 [Parcubacteria group bacterium CG_4_10_14_0_8_um_filter_35_7]|nr:MAG: hypothetical protein COY82_01820 [Parcubacteria group bacterium CG_4_10_14_0_8_um_filter_35_7]
MDYQEDLTEKQLKIGYWYLTHKAILNKYLVIFLIVLNIVLWGYSGYRWVMYYIETPSYEKMIAEMPKDLINWKDFHEKHQPQPLQVIETTAISLGKGKYDLVAKIENPNIHWMVEDFKYQFSLGGSLKETKESFVLPGEAKFLIDLGVRGAGEANVIFKDIDWFRISKFEILKKERLDFVFKNIHFVPASFEEEGKIPISKVTFDAANQSVYNFWEVGFYVILYRGTEIVGVNYITLERFFSGEKRSVEVKWYEKLPQVTKVIVEPEVNILDEEIFMPLEGEIMRFEEREEKIKR